MSDDGFAVVEVEARGASVVKRVAAPVSRASWRMLRREYWLLSMLRLDGAPRVRRFGLLPDRSAELELDHLPGSTLDELRTTGDTRAPLVALVDVAFTLSELHAVGFVHGDVAPRNVLVHGRGEDARGWLIDFGFATRAGARSRLVRGTPVTLAPEVAAGEAASVQSDLFSLGSLIRAALVGAASAPGAAGLGDPQALARLVDELVAPDPAKRPDSAHEVACRLGRALTPPRSQHPCRC